MTLLILEKPKKPTGTVDILLWEEEWIDPLKEHMPYPWYFIQKGYRAYSLKELVKNVSLARYRNQLLHQYGLQTLVDEEKDLFYVR
jgi:hypothetical protein